MKTTIKILGIVTVITLFAFVNRSINTKQKAQIQKAKEVAVVIPKNEPTKPDKQMEIKVALLLDTSNSMDGLIDQAKAQLWEIINELSYAKYGKQNPNLDIALYEYGNDGLEKSDDYIRKVIDFSNDLDVISEKLFALKTNGGSEYCGTVIKTSLDDLKWGKNDDDLNLIFIAGNEAFTQGKINYIDATADAKEKGVTVNTIFCGEYRNGVAGSWKDGADQTAGDYFAIDHNKKQVHIVTPYDDIIIQLNVKLNKTYIGYGSQGHSKTMLQSRQDDNAMELDKEVAVKRAVSKSSRMYTNSTWDLVDASKKKDFKYEEVETESLPLELQGKSTEEIKKHVEEQEQKRSEIQKQIGEYNKKRIEFIAKQNKSGNKDNLENALIKTIKKQAKSKNYTW
jgi:hypothetical protein